MRKITAVLMAMLMLLSCAVMPVAAETTAPADTTQTTAPADVPTEDTAVTESMQIFEKTYSLHMDQYRGEIVSDTLAAAFWEYPVFETGQRYTIDGLLVIRNDSNMTADVRLDGVSLPYGDEQRMNYLNHLMLTVTELTTETVTVPAETTATAAPATDPTAAQETAQTTAPVTVTEQTVQKETVLFDGAYAHINDAEGGLHLVYENMQPDEEHTYRITMRCLYTYRGDPNEDTSWLKWNFSAQSRATVIYEEEQGLPEWAKLTIMVFAATIALLIVIMIITGIYNFVKNAKERKAAKLENKDIKAAKKAEKQRKKEEKQAQKDAAKRLKAAGMYQPSPDDREEPTEALAEEATVEEAEEETEETVTAEPASEEAQTADEEKTEEE